MERTDKVVVSDRRGVPTGLFDVSFEMSFHFLPIGTDAIIAIDNRTSDRDHDFQEYTTNTNSFFVTSWL